MGYYAVWPRGKTVRYRRRCFYRWSGVDLPVSVPNTPMGIFDGRLHRHLICSAVDRPFEESETGPIVVSSKPFTSTLGWRLTCFSRVPIYIDVDFLVFLFLAFQALQHTYREELRFLILHTALLSVGSSLLIAVFLTLHEFGHILIARHFGNGAIAIQPNYFGVAASLERDVTSPQEEFQIAIAGPLLSVLIALFFMAMQSWGGVLLRNGGSISRVQFSGLLYEISGVCVVSNWGIAVFNLLPFFPMDGGRILRSAIWAITGKKRVATRLASACALVGILFLGVLAFRAFQQGADGPGLRLSAFAVLLSIFSVSNFRSEVS
jgi:Zn-dependent protease